MTTFPYAPQLHSLHIVLIAAIAGRSGSNWPEASTIREARTALPIWISAPCSTSRDSNHALIARKTTPKIIDHSSAADPALGELLT